MNAPPRNETARDVAASPGPKIGLLEEQTVPKDSTREEQPEHRSDRRRFVIFALMAGLVPTERVTERILAEVAEETHGH